MGRRRSFINRSVGPFTFIFLCFRHFHVQREAVLFCPRRRSQAEKGSTSLMSPPLGALEAQTRGRRTYRRPLRPTLCRKQAAQPPSPTFLYKPLVFRKFRVATRGDWRRRNVAKRPSAALAQRRAKNGGKREEAVVEEGTGGRRRTRRGMGTAHRAKDGVRMQQAPSHQA